MILKHYPSALLRALAAFHQLRENVFLPVVDPIHGRGLSQWLTAVAVSIVENRVQCGYAVHPEVPPRHHLRSSPRPRKPAHGPPAAPPPPGLPSLGAHLFPPTMGTVRKILVPFLAFCSAVADYPDDILIHDISHGMPLSGHASVSGALPRRAIPASVPPYGLAGGLPDRKASILLLVKPYQDLELGRPSWQATLKDVERGRLEDLRLLCPWGQEYRLFSPLFAIWKRPGSIPAQDGVV